MERRPTPGTPLCPTRVAWLIPPAAMLHGAVLLLLMSPAVVAAGDPQLDRRQQARFDGALRREADALIDLADDAMKGRPAPSDFPMEWRNDFLKAQPGTFVPFTLSIGAAVRSAPGALIYLRVVERTGPGAGRGRGQPFAYETIFPVEIDPQERQPLRVRRGFTVPPGRYSVYVVLRERPADLLARPNGTRRGAVLVQSLDVPDFWTDSLTASTVILAERVEPLAEPLPPGALEEDPYVVGITRVYPVSGETFSRGQELVVVFLIYNPSVGQDKHFDVQVDYHLYRKLREGERYLTRTNPQRFNPSMMGASYDPASDQPVLAGQGILLSDFETGDYRLRITVTDLLSRKTVTRDASFTVIGS